MLACFCCMLMDAYLLALYCDVNPAAGQSIGGFIRLRRSHCTLQHPLSQFCAACTPASHSHGSCTAIVLAEALAWANVQPELWHAIAPGLGEPSLKDMAEFVAIDPDEVKQVIRSVEWEGQRLRILRGLYTCLSQQSERLFVSQEFPGTSVVRRCVVCHRASFPSTRCYSPRSIVPGLSLRIEKRVPLLNLGIQQR